MLSKYRRRSLTALASLLSKLCGTSFPLPQAGRSLTMQLQDLIWCQACFSVPCPAPFLALVQLDCFFKLELFRQVLHAAHAAHSFACQTYLHALQRPPCTSSVLRQHSQAERLQHQHPTRCSNLDFTIIFTAFSVSRRGCHRGALKGFNIAAARAAAVAISSIWYIRGIRTAAYRYRRATSASRHRATLSSCLPLHTQLHCH